jgi:hypothetical protein
MDACVRFVGLSTFAGLFVSGVGSMSVSFFSAFNV